MRASGKLLFNQLPLLEINGMNLVQTGNPCHPPSLRSFFAALSSPHTIYFIKGRSNELYSLGAIIKYLSHLGDLDASSAEEAVRAEMLAGGEYQFRYFFYYIRYFDEDGSVFFSPMSLLVLRFFFVLASDDTPSLQE